jgi:hypothetical protein
VSGIKFTKLSLVVIVETVVEWAVIRFHFGNTGAPNPKASFKPPEIFGGCFFDKYPLKAYNLTTKSGERKNAK